MARLQKHLPQLLLLVLLLLCAGIYFLREPVSQIVRGVFAGDTPSEISAADSRRAFDLYNISRNVRNFYFLGCAGAFEPCTESLPSSLERLTETGMSASALFDPEKPIVYPYARTSETVFTVCATPTDRKATAQFLENTFLPPLNDQPYSQSVVVQDDTQVCVLTTVYPDAYPHN